MARHIGTLSRADAEEQYNILRMQWWEIRQKRDALQGQDLTDADFFNEYEAYSRLLGALDDLCAQLQTRF